MGDMAEIFADMREHNKKIREKRSEKNIPKLQEIGAIEKQDGVWELDGWFLYPSKNFAMNKRNQAERKNLRNFIEERRLKV